MFDWKEFFPVDALGPLVGGGVLWFGLNYLVLAPDVIGPRLAERHYLPACVAAVEQGRAVAADKVRAMDAAIEAEISAHAARVGEQAQGQMKSILGGIFGTYGAEGRAYVERYGDQLANPGGLVTMAIGEGVAKRRAALHAEKEEELDRLRAQQKFGTAAEFCACNVGQAFGERVELAAYTASLRLYEPERMKALARGEVFGDACGAPPVL